MSTKICSTCKREYLLSEYHDDRRATQGKSSQCRHCRSGPHTKATSVINMPRLVAVLDRIRAEPDTYSALENYELHRDIAVHAYQNTLDRIAELEATAKLTTQRLAEQSASLRTLQDYLPTFIEEILALLQSTPVK